MRALSLGWEDSLEKGKATHSSILVWKIPWTEEPGELQSLGSQRVGHDWVTEHTHTHTRNQEKWYWWTYLQGRNRDTEVKNGHVGISLVVQQLRLHTPNAEGLGSISGQGNKPTWLELKAGTTNQINIKKKKKKKNGHMDTAGEGERRTNWVSSIDVYILPRVK